MSLYRRLSRLRRRRPTSGTHVIRLKDCTDFLIIDCRFEADA